jgi:2,5-furandicarboxylate decarboxylase 1
MLRRYLQFLDDAGQLVRITKPVATRHELAAVSWKLKGTPVIFENVVGHSLPVVSNLCSDRAMLARMLGLSLDEFVEYFLRAIESPVASEIVSESSLYEVVIENDIHLTQVLPITLDYDRQGAPGINSGVMVARDAQNGLLNTSFHVLEVISQDEFSVHVVSQHFARIYAHYQRQGRPLPVALALGVDPLTWMTCTLAISHPPSELDVAGAIRKHAIQLVQCKTNDLAVLADAEIVLEGEILPTRREAIGPEPRPRGVYGPPTTGPVFKVKCIAHRKDALFHHLANSSADHLNLSAISKEVTLFPYLRERYPSVTRLSCVGNTCVVAIKRDGATRIRPMLEDILRYRTIDRGSFNKFAVVVDEDVDVYDRRDVEQALYTRAISEAVVILKGIRANQGEPSATDGMVEKIGIDATIPIGRENQFQRPYIPGSKDLDLASYLPGNMVCRLAY